MTARQIDGAATRLRELRADAYEDLGLAGVAFSLALAASVLHPPVALPLLAGALWMTFLGMRAYVARYFLVEELAHEPEAYELPDVRRFGARAASTRNRRLVARSLRGIAEGSTAERGERVAAVCPELMAIIAILEDENTELAPSAAVALDRSVQAFRDLLADPSRSETELRSQLRTVLTSLGR